MKHLKKLDIIKVGVNLQFFITKCGTDNMKTKRGIYFMTLQMISVFLTPGACGGHPGLRWRVPSHGRILRCDQGAV